MPILCPRLVNLLRILWVTVVVWYELGTFFYHVASCPWPDTSLLSPTGPSPTHVLIVADPQVLDHRSYPDRGTWLMLFSQLMVDLNLRKSWRAAMRMRPDAVVFLGDMMDDGRFAMSDEEYESYYRRFRSIFKTDDSLPSYYLPGNHDIGLGSSYLFSNDARERYISHFGPLNQQIEIANHTLLLVDALKLVEEDQQRARSGMSYAHWAAAMPGGTIEFAQTFAADEDHSPVVLFSHVPLARPEGTSCGPHRERGTIRQGTGFGYQNILSSQASQFLLQGTRPSIVFSGDDHDYCEYVHTIAPTEGTKLSRPISVLEVTVKSFSMAMGVHRPGYQLLSLIPTSDIPLTTEASLAHTPCLLPDQIRIYLSVYLPLFMATVILLLLSSLGRARARYRRAPKYAVTSRDRRSSTDSVTAFELTNRKPDVSYALPPPSSSRSERRTAWTRSWTFSLGGRRRRITLSSGLFASLLSCLCTKASDRSRQGFLRGFLLDVCDVAWAPVLLFAVIACWAF